MEMFFQRENGRRRIDGKTFPPIRQVCAYSAPCAKEAVKTLRGTYLPGELACALDGSFQPLPDPVAPQQGYNFEEPGADGFARQCHTKGVDERSCFHTSVVSNPSDRELDRPDVERLDTIERSRGSAEMLDSDVTAQMLSDCCVVPLEVVGEEEAPERDVLIETLGAGLQHLEHGKEPGVTIIEEVLTP